MLQQTQFPFKTKRTNYAFALPIGFLIGVLIVGGTVFYLNQNSVKNEKE
jgi:hypothetical protein